jgi:hypothetical protein
MRNRDGELDDDYEDMRRDQQERQRYGRGYGDRERIDYRDDRARVAQQPTYDPERDRYGERWHIEDYRRAQRGEERSPREGRERFERVRDVERERSPAGEHEGHGTRFYGSRDFGWYGGHGRGGRDFGASREFEREDYERPGLRTSMRPDYTGRGPRGYKRSDERIREEVCDCLMQDPEVDATNIDVRVQDGTVILDGTIDSRRMKHRAENLCEWVSGVQDVTNHLRVRREGLYGSEQQPATGMNAGSIPPGGPRRPAS